MYLTGLYSLFDEVGWSSDAWAFSNSLYKVQDGWVSRGSIAGFDTDYYQITLPSSGAFTITVSNDSSNNWGTVWSTGFVYAAVVDSYGVTQAGLTTSAYGSADGVLSLTWGGSYSTDFYLKVYGYSNASYVVKLADFAVNHAPVVATPMPNQDWTEGASLVYTVPAGTFTDADGHTLSYSATLSTGAALPAWLSFNTSTHVFSGTAPVGSPDYTVRVTVTDGSLSTYDDVVFSTVAQANQTITGTSGPDTLFGGAGNDYIDGGAGNDVLDGDAGNDTIVGGAGNDYVSYLFAPSAVTVDLALGIATGGSGNDTLSGIEYVLGSSYDDTINGDDNANYLLGGAGADTINGGAGDDLLDGGQCQLS